MKSNVHVLGRHAGILEQVGDFKSVMSYLPDVAPENLISLTMPVRTESYPRPPYSEATYYIYEQSGRTICTKLEVCNKFDDCSAQYIKGAYWAKEDKDTGDPYQKSPSVLIPPAKLNKHVCLRRFKLIAE